MSCHPSRITEMVPSKSNRANLMCLVGLRPEIISSVWVITVFLMFFCAFYLIVEVVARFDSAYSGKL